MHQTLYYCSTRNSSIVAAMEKLCTLKIVGTYFCMLSTSRSTYFFGQRLHTTSFPIVDLYWGNAAAYATENHRPLGPLLVFPSIVTAYIMAGLKRNTVL
jgi:hypothetical protein